MSFNRATFALVFASALPALTTAWGESGLMIDPDGKPAPAASSWDTGPRHDSGLMIDPNG